MSTIKIDELSPILASWRHDLHQYPEFGFEEKRTSAFVANELSGFGLEVAQGIGVTGVIGTLKKGTSKRVIALRADIDALRIQEQGQLAHRSLNKGLMHACGQDGHTSMLLGAAKWLALNGNFDGTIRFIFQPAEEWGKGALAMLNDGLLERFPFDEIYGIHNWPGLPIGHFATTTGALMAAEDNFEITLNGVGGHASRPHAGREVLVAASSLVLDLQTIVSRRVNPSDTAVVSATELITDGTRNALPGKAIIKGDVRSFSPSISQIIETEMRRITSGTAIAYDCDIDVVYSREFIPLLNEAQSTATALSAAEKVFAKEAINKNFERVTVSEDFAQFLKFVPGNFSLIGNGEKSWSLHNPNYDFNDEALIYGTKYFVELIQTRLASIQ
ncbi:M20 aminoacylase family protein [soil metagenome]